MASFLALHAYGRKRYLFWALAERRVLALRGIVESDDLEEGDASVMLELMKAAKAETPAAPLASRQLVAVRRNRNR